MKIDVPVWFIFCISGVASLLFMPPEIKDFIDAVDYCSSVNNSVLSTLNDGMRARQTCVMTYSDIWYRRRDTDPTLKSKKPEGMCYVYGNYWRPCRDKVWFFCYDKNGEDQIKCNRHAASKFPVSENFYRRTKEDVYVDNKIKVSQSKASPIQLNTHEILLVAGSAIAGALISMAFVGVVMICRKAEIKTSGDYMAPVEGANHGSMRSAIESPWYDTATETKYETPHIYETAEKRIYDYTL